ncbi:peptidase inhibitor 16-like [Hippocampus comes]|uniref:peptidase inhibitor 16-like n=1 Tax=Hippocampus comes TaxID=109280 RepID=UPI00094E23E4|nr:PREDICTED: peptidase inhibitor 16-like [Hippocampus comes]
MQLQVTLQLQKVRQVPARRGRVSNFSKGSGAPLWAWLLLSTLLAPGAWSLLSEEEELLVELHNYYRGQVSPSASAMLPLKWDPMLKLVAEGYAAKCIWNHNPDLEDTGENLFAGTGPLDLRVALEKWFLEHLYYDFHNNSCNDDKMCGHYTQMVWSDTHRVGCAAHLCNNMEGLAWEKISFLVCNYYPAGNYEEERPYVEGDSCSQCPEKLQKCENNLCVPDMDDNEGGEEEEEQTIFHLPTTTVESYHQGDITTRTSRTSKTPRLLLTDTLPPYHVTSEPKFFSGEEEKEDVPVLSLTTTETYHQADIISRTIPPPLSSTSAQRKAAMRKEEDLKGGQQETRMDGLPIITISHKEMTSDASSPSPFPLMLFPLLSFTFFILSGLP